jgi:hypothetical protein
MRINKEETLVFLKVFLAMHNIRHEITEFDSGYKMIDIWCGKNLYVVQIEDERIGLSLVDDNTGFFDVEPVEKYDNIEIVLERLKAIFC